MKISLVSFNSTSASALYPFQMAQAIAASGQCELQIIVAKRAYNIVDYRDLAKKHAIDLCEFETYEHDSKSVLLSFFNIDRFKRIFKCIERFGPDVIYFPFGCVWSPILFPFLQKIAPIINTIHDPHPHDQLNILGSLFWKLNSWAISKINSIIVLNTKDAQFTRDTYNKPVSIIPHSAFSFYSKLAKGIDSKIIKHQICFVGRIEPYKGVPILVDAFCNIHTKGVKLVIAGSGAICDETKSKIADNPNIELINRFVSDEEMVGIIEHSDFMVLPYLRASQSGVIPMSFALGRTVIATRVGALGEQVKDGTGILVEPDSNSITKAIDAMYADEAAIVAKSKCAKHYADTELTWSHSAELLMEHIRQYCLHV